MGELIVKYGNEVNRAARRLTTSELRILFVAIAKNFQVKDRCLECRVSAQELISLGSDPSTAYADLRQAVERCFIAHEHGTILHRFFDRFEQRLQIKALIVV